MKGAEVITDFEVTTLTDDLSKGFLIYFGLGVVAALWVGAGDVRKIPKTRESKLNIEDTRVHPNMRIPEVTSEISTAGCSVVVISKTLVGLGEPNDSSSGSSM